MDSTNDCHCETPLERANCGQYCTDRIFLNSNTGTALEHREPWVSVEDGLPEILKDPYEDGDYCEKVIAANENIVYSETCTYWPLSKEWHMSGDYLTNTVKVTHWMPLPSPPTSPTKQNS